MAKALMSRFQSSDEVITALSSSSREEKRYEREEDFINALVTGDPEPGKQGLYPGEVTRMEIVRAMVGSGLVHNPDSLLGKALVGYHLRRIHQTNYWKGYSFIPLTRKGFDHTLYKVRLDDVSGLGPI